MDRRNFLRGLALGGAVVAGELWIPGQKLISIPKLKTNLPPGWEVEQLETGVYKVTHNIMSAADFRAIIEPELNRIFDGVYADYESLRRSAV